MASIISLLITDSIILSWILPRTMKGPGLHSVTWLTAMVSDLEPGEMAVRILIILAVETGFFLLAKAIVGRMYLAFVRRLLRYGCGTPELMTRIDAFHIPETLKKRLRMEVAGKQDGTDT